VVVDALVSDKAADSKAKFAGIKSFEEAEAKFEKVKKDLSEAKAKYDFKQYGGHKAEALGRAGVVGSGPCRTHSARSWDKANSECNVSSTIPLVTVGAWRNQAVRADMARDTPERRSAAAPNTEVPSNKETRAQENNDCIGGLRSPWKAVRRLPRLAVSAAKVRKYFNAQFEKDPCLIDVVGLLGKAVVDGSSEKKWLDKEAQRLGADLAELLGGSGLAEKGREGAE
jgi:hypothetical protein